MNNKVAQQEKKDMHVLNSYDQKIQNSRSELSQLQEDQSLLQSNQPYNTNANMIGLSFIPSYIIDKLELLLKQLQDKQSSNPNHHQNQQQQQQQQIQEQEQELEIDKQESSSEEIEDFGYNQLKMDHSEHIQTKYKCCKTFFSYLVQLIFIPFRGLEYIMDGGKKSNKIFIRKMMLKEEISTKEKDEQILRREKQKILYYWEMFLFLIQYLFMPSINTLYFIIHLVLVLFSSTLCLCNLFLWSYYNRGILDYQELYDYLIVTDYIIVIAFSIELIFNVTFSLDLNEVFDFENALLLIIITEIIWTNTQQDVSVFFYFIHVLTYFIPIYQSLRSLRATKLRFITKLFSHYINRYINHMMDDDLQNTITELDEEEEMNKFIIEELVNFASGILVETSFILALDRTLGYTAIYPYHIEGGEKMDYIRAAYFVIISFSTIGYGDIFPVDRIARLVMCFLLVINITVMSSFLGNLIAQIFSLSPYNREYDFKDHVIIIGYIDQEQIMEFLEELVENDIVERSIGLIDQFKMGIKCIIVTDDEPTNSQRIMVEYLSDKHENEIVFLRENIFAYHRKWYHKANVQEAKVLFCFSKDSDDPRLSYSIDQLMSITAKNIKDDFQFLRVYLILNSEFKQQIDNDSYFKDIETISKREINEYITASSLQNPGLSTSLQHLFTMKRKNAHNDVVHVAKNDDFLFAYIRDMQSEIYKIDIPDFFVGTSFQKFAQMLYLLGLETNLDNFQKTNFIQHEIMKENNSITLIAVETIADEQFVSMEDVQSEDENKDDKTKSFTFKMTNQKKFNRSIFPSSEQTQIFINPQNYKIRKNDVGYVICGTFELANQCKEIVNKKSTKLIQIQKNFQLIYNGMDTKERRQNLINQFYQNPQQKIQQNQSKERFFNLSETEGVKLYNHFIIFGKFKRFLNIIWDLRKYSNNPIILYTQDELNPQTWQDICNTYNEVYCFKGYYLELVHLHLLNLSFCKQALITTELINDNSQFPDAIGICVSRILLDYFDFNNFLLELKDEDKIMFLQQNPLLKNKICSNFQRLSYIQGNVYFSSMPTSVLARLVFNQSWIKLLESLIIPDIQTKILCNKIISTITLNEEQANFFQYFGILQFSLMEHEPSLLAITLIKQKIGSKFQYLKENQILNKQQLQAMTKDYKKLDKWESELKGVPYSQEQSMKKFREYVKQTLGRMIGNRFVLTNPNFYTPIEKRDNVIVIGQVEQSDLAIPSLGDFSRGNSFFQRCSDDSRKSYNFKERQEIKNLVIEELEFRIKQRKKMEQYSQLFNQK